MKIIIASTIVPFIEGGGTFIVDWTEKKLEEAGHTVDVFKIPFSHQHPYVLEQTLALRLLHLSDSCDRLISIRTPSYALSHPNHVCWFIHHYRYAYEYWDTNFQTGIPKNRAGYREREGVINADNKYLRELKKIFTNSKEVSGRLKKYNNLDSEVLYPPLLEEKDFKNKLYGDYIYYSSRIAGNKRQLLAVQAMKYTRTKVRLLITGKPDTPSNALELQQYVEKENLSEKVKIIDTWITEREKFEYFANCRAAIYIPYDEDSYGYPTLEAFASKKCVVTCTDSGGTDEIVTDGYNGYIVNPQPALLARKMDELYLNVNKAEEMGHNGYCSLQEKNISWEHVVTSLTKRRF